MSLGLTINMSGRARLAGQPQYANLSATRACPRQGRRCSTIITAASYSAQPAVADPHTVAEEPQRAPRYMPNCLVRFSLAAPPKRYCDFGQVKDALRDTFPNCTPLYVDYNKGESDGYVRFGCAEDVEEVLAATTTNPEVLIIGGEAAAVEAVRGEAEAEYMLHVQGVRARRGTQLRQQGATQRRPQQGRGGAGRGRRSTRGGEGRGARTWE